MMGKKLNYRNNSIQRQKCWIFCLAKKS